MEGLNLPTFEVITIDQSKNVYQVYIKTLHDSIMAASYGEGSLERLEEIRKDLLSLATHIENIISNEKYGKNERNIMEGTL